MISVKTTGKFDKTKARLEKRLRKEYFKHLDKYAQRGLEALQKATPVRTGATAGDWYYVITDNGSSLSIKWCNDYKPYGVSVALLIQYGHATRGSTYVEGIDYINPALAPIFDDIKECVRKEVLEA